MPHSLFEPSALAYLTQYIASALTCFTGLFLLHHIIGSSSSSYRLLQHGYYFHTLAEACRSSIPCITLDTCRGETFLAYALVIGYLEGHHVGNLSSR